MDIDNLEARLAQVLAGGASPMQDELLAPLIRVSPLLFATLCMRGPPQPPFNGRLLFSKAQLEWEDIFTRESRYCILASRGSGKTAICTVIHALWRCATEPDGSGYIFSGTEFGAQRILEDIKSEIEKNPKLAWLFPGPKSRKWTASQIRTTNGHHLVAKGMLTRVRGAHPSRLYVDDAQTDEDGWSRAKRLKTQEYFFSTMSNMVMPGGQIGVVGCVTAETLINSVERGLIPIGNFAPQEASNYSRRKAQLMPLCHPVVGKDGPRDTSHFWCNGNTRGLGITLQCGLGLNGSSRHPVWVMDKNTGIPAWKKLKELEIGDYVAVKPGANTFGAPIDLRPVHASRIVETSSYHTRPKRFMALPATVTPDLAYLIGLFISEGSRCPMGRVSISSMDPDIRRFLSNRPFKMAFKPGTSESTFHTMRCSCRHFYIVLRHLGLRTFETASKKSVPARLMSAPRDVVIGLLQGLYDGDGCVQASRRYVHYCTTSFVLAYQMQQLLLNLGIVAFRRKSKSISPPSEIATANYFCWNLHCFGEDAATFCSLISFRVMRKRNQGSKIHQTGRGRNIPHQSPLINSMLRSWGMRKVELKSQRNSQGAKIMSERSLGEIQKEAKLNFSEARKPERNIRASTLRKIIESLGMHKDPSRESQHAQENIQANLFWSPVNDIETFTAPTYDFVIPEGHSFLANGIVSHNTPMHSEDLLSELGKNPTYKNYIYPAEDKDGRSTWSDVYSDEFLKNLKKEIGSVRYARERLCRPVSDDASLFPRSLFFESDMMMPQAKLGEPSEYWRRMGINRFFIGVDFALSTSASADFWVLIVVGLDDNANRWIVDINRGRGLSFSGQKNRIVSYGRRYDPEVITLEANAYQAVAANELKRLTDLPIRSFTTTAQKHSLTDGLPSLRILLENGKYRFPRGDKNSVEMTDILIDEANNFTWLNGQAKSVGGHDDVCMALYVCEQGIRKGQRSSSFVGGISSDATSTTDMTTAIQNPAQWAPGQAAAAPIQQAAARRSLMPHMQAAAPQFGGGKLIMRNGVFVRGD